MRVHIVTPANRHLYTEQIDEMHRQRRRVFVERLKWTELDGGGAYEIDEVDHDAAVYLLALGDVGEVLGSARLAPTWRPHLFAAALQRYLDDPKAATGPGVWEYSRWLPGEGTDQERDAEVRKLLLCATAEFAVAHQVEAYVACIETRFLNIFAECGWPLEMLGRPQRYPRGKAVAVRFTIGMTELAETRARFDCAGPASIELPAWLPGRPIKPVVFAMLDGLLGVEDEALLQEALEHCNGIFVADAQARRVRDHGDLLLVQPQGRA